MVLFLQVPNKTGDDGVPVGANTPESPSCCCLCICFWDQNGGIWREPGWRWQGSMSALGASQLSYRFGAAYSESKFRGFSLFFAAKGVLWLKPTALGAVVTSGSRSADAWGSWRAGARRQSRGDCSQRSPEQGPLNRYKVGDQCLLCSTGCAAWPPEC